MKQAEKKFIYEIDIILGRAGCSGQQITTIREEVRTLYQSQFKSPLVISEKEIEEHYKKMWEQKPLGTVTEFGWVAGAKFVLSLSSERAMEFAEWVGSNNIMMGYSSKENKEALWDHDDWDRMKSTSALFDIFAKEKGYK